MPIGVPKVPFRSPGEEDAVWVDVYNRLHRERLLFLGQEVDSEISNQLVGLMVYLSIEDDTMQFVSPDVHTICMGLAASMGSFILVGGEITKRLAFPHARVMIHQPASSFYEAQAGEFILEAEELLKLRETLTKVYVQRTGNPLWVISEDMERDVFMSATEAQAHGIVDLVAVENENTGDFV
uniref:ATP-dependent Clp protease proteolytic subunit n=1 Tax=Doryanthes palmeri TaxID=182178 RepID=H2FD31_DORPM|nr:clp protease proteolytic subunit [Doryanthes palmeri]